MQPEKLSDPVRTGHARGHYMREADILIVGAGPAGMAAAVRARESGRRVTVLDDNPTAGGQIWRGGGGPEWFGRFQKSGAELFAGARVFGGDAQEKTLQVETFAGMLFNCL